MCHILSHSEQGDQVFFFNTIISADCINIVIIVDINAMALGLTKLFYFTCPIS